MPASPPSPVVHPRAFESILATVSARLIAVEPADIRRAIEATLSDILAFCRVDRSALLVVSPDEQWAGVHSAAYADGVPHLPTDANFIRLHPWAASMLLREREALRFSRMDDLPAAATSDVSAWTHQGVRSTLCVPLVVGGRISHLIGVDTIFEERDWPDALVTQLKILGELVATAALRVEAWLALEESQERLTRTAAASGTGLWDLEMTSGDIWLTDQTRQVYGIGPATPATWEHFVTLVHPDDRARTVAAITQAIEHGSTIDIDYRIVASDGAERWIHAVGRASGSRLLGASVDVTGRVESDRRWREEAARVAAAVDVAGIGFSEMTAGRPPYLDARLRDLMGLQPGDEQRLPDIWLDRIDPADREMVREQRGLLIDGQVEAINIEYRYAHPTRGWCWLRHASRRTSGGPDGEQTRLVGAVEDITERRSREESLKAARAADQVMRDRLERENLYLRREVSAPAHVALVSGRSAAIRRARDMSDQVAPTSSTVLLLGETGTGKERFAQYIHEASPRRQHHMVRVNCSAIPSALIESELFGREKGAYTGAMSRQIGRFELAHGSTLFLDEIGDLPADVQVRLLRALQERTIERLGSPTPITIDVRVIAATNRDLEAAVRAGTFRADLYYRLNVFPITLPPLRDRIEDLPTLVDVLVEDLAASIRKQFDAVDAASLEALARYHWPGNVRELRNVLERAMILATSPTLTVVPPEQVGPVAPAAATTPTPVTTTLPASHALGAIEREHILRVLEQTGWRIRGPQAAAALLGLKPTTLEARMQRLGIHRPGR